MTSYAADQRSLGNYLDAELNYQQERIERSTPLQLTCILYEGAIQAVEQARTFLKQGDILARGRAIARAQSILLELIESLDRKKGGEFATRMGLLYDYMLAKLGEAHSQQTVEPLKEVDRLLKDLFESWQQIAGAESASLVAGGDARIDLAG